MERNKRGCWSSSAISFRMAARRVVMRAIVDRQVRRIHPKNTHHTTAAALNYDRQEAGRFEEVVSYGLKSFAHDGVT